MRNKRFSFACAAVMALSLLGTGTAVPLLGPLPVFGEADFIPVEDLVSSDETVSTPVEESSEDASTPLDKVAFDLVNAVAEASSILSGESSETGSEAVTAAAEDTSEAVKAPVEEVPEVASESVTTVVEEVPEAVTEAVAEAAQTAVEGTTESITELITEAGTTPGEDASESITEVVTTVVEDTSETSTPPVEASSETGEEDDENTVSEGSVLNIYCWNDEFKNRVTDHYPGYEAVDNIHGKIGDLNVTWNITENKGNLYQQNLDQALLSQESKADDEKVDIFLVEADYAKKYLNTSFALPVEELGITEEELSRQYQYTRDIACDLNGVLKGLSWQACPAGLIYNRAIAQDVLGTDDPAEVQEYVKDWDSFKKTADLMKKKGYLMTSGVNETFRLYSNNSEDAFVQYGKLSISKDMLRWIDDSKELIKKKETTSAEQWGNEWKTYFYPQEKGGAFCYFGPLWYFAFCMEQDQEGSIAYEGGWGLTEGPQPFYWGGSWICAAAGTDNKKAIADLMRLMTTDHETMKAIATEDHDYVNNVDVIAELAGSDDGKTSVLGGQNPYGMLSTIADSINPKNLTAYDQGCVEQLQNAMKEYFEGHVKKEEAIMNYYSAVEKLYPELTHQR